MSTQPKRLWLTLASLLILITASLAFWLTRGYGEVTPEGYRLANALYSVCNQQDPKRLEELKTLIDQAAEQQQLPNHQRRWLESIIRRAENGNWQAAARETRRLIRDQVTQQPPAGTTNSRHARNNSHQH